MQIAATPYAFFLHSTSFALSSILQLHLSFHDYHWLATISKCQTEKINNDGTCFLQNIRASTQSH